jgi:hypothetical protein
MPVINSESLRNQILCDPFTGAWTFHSEWSRLTTSPPRSWIMRIEATSDAVNEREEIVSSDGARTVVTFQARFDGKDYPVTGSPLADTIAYTRVDPHHISGIAKKNGSISIRERVATSPEGHILTLTYSIYADVQEVANGIAIFERTAGDSILSVA